MKYFIAYRHTGADPAYLEQLLPAIREAFKSSGLEVYCTYFDEDGFKAGGYTPASIMKHAFAKIEEMGNLFVLLDGVEKSEGQLMEIGYCQAKSIPITVAIRRGVTNTYVPEMADKVLEYSDIEELVSAIKAMSEDK